MRTPFGAWRLTYTAGRWIVLSGARTAVVLQPAPPAASGLLNSIWDDVVGQSSLSDLVRTLAECGLDAMPNMAVLFWDDEQIHALLRGEIEVLDAETGQVIGSGVGARTWFETTFATPHIYMALDPVDTASMLQLPLVQGAAAVSALYLDARAGEEALAIDDAEALGAGVAVDGVAADGAAAGATAVPADAPGVDAAVILPGMDVDDDVFGGAEPLPTMVLPDRPPYAPGQEPVETDEPTHEVAEEAEVPVEREIVAEPEAELEAELEAEPEAVAEPEPEAAPVAAPEQIVDPADEAPAPDVPDYSQRDEAQSQEFESHDVQSDEEPAQHEPTPQGPAGVAFPDLPDVPDVPDLHDVHGADQVEDEVPFPADLPTDLPTEDAQAVPAEAAEPVEATPVEMPEQPWGDAQAEQVEESDEQPIPVPDQGDVPSYPEPVAHDMPRQHDVPAAAEVTQPDAPAQPVPSPEAPAAEVAPEASVGFPVPGFVPEFPTPAPAPAPEVPVPSPAPAPEVPTPAPVPEVPVPSPAPVPEVPVPAPAPAAPVPPVAPEVPPVAPVPAPEFPPVAPATTPAQPVAQPQAQPAVQAPAQPQAQPAAEVPAPAPTEPAAPDYHASSAPRVVETPSDNDGETVFADAIAATHKPAPAAAGGSDWILAATCPFGHPNRPGVANCRLCGARVDSHHTSLIARPLLTVLYTPEGQAHPLTGPILVGRAPNGKDDLNAELLRVASPNNDISRTHVRIAPRDWDIEVTDLHSTNGTMVVHPDGTMEELEPGRGTLVSVGDAIDLGDGQVIVLRPQ